MTILHVSPDAPPMVRYAAEALLMTHIGAGTGGIISGYVTLLSRKGERLHRIAGTVFFVSMLIMAAIGASVSPFLPKPEPANVAAGIMTFYLVATSWLTIRRKDGGIGRLEFAFFGVVLTVAVVTTFLVLRAANSHLRTLGGQPLQVFWAFALVAGIAAAFDLKVILKGGITSAPRIARHLWRMCLALTTASGSFFLGQQKFLPAALHGSSLLLVPVLAPLVLMAFWLIRVRLTNWFTSEPVAA
jgi:hypothetical protein